MDDHPVVSRDEWLRARKEFLAKEKEFTRLRDELSAERRALPWVKVEKNYVFQGPDGPASLADLFGDKSQLVVYHFMFGPDWEEGCKNCSFCADNYDGATVHLAHRDVSFVAVSRGALDKLQAYRKRMGWRFPWVSSAGSDFNFDFHVSFTPDAMAKGEVYYNYRTTKFPSEEAPGLSAFYKNAAGEIFHTYSCYARGLDMLLGAYHYLDIVPKGRDEADLSYSMEWIHRHDQYED